MNHLVSGATGADDRADPERGHRHVTTHYFAEPTLDAQNPARAIVLRRMMPVPWEAPKPTVGQAVASVFLNALVCPGVGSMVGGRTGTGVAQMTLFALGLPMALFVVGIPMMIVAWIWGMVTGAQLLRDARD